MMILGVGGVLMSEVPLQKGVNVRVNHVLMHEQNSRLDVGPNGHAERSS